MKKYLVNMTSSLGRSKNIIIEGRNLQEVTAEVKKKYPTNKIERISDKKYDIDFFESIKRMEKK
jgi:hypothetical protein